MLSRFFRNGRRPFDSLSEQEILALAISSEEDDARIYLSYADGLRDEFPQSAKIFEQMAAEEHEHRDALIERHRARFGERIPLIRREHVSGYFERKPDWLVRPLGIDKVRDAATQMEEQAYRFYIEAAKRVTDAGTRKLLGDLAQQEKKHEVTAEALEHELTPHTVQDEERALERKRFILTYVQPGLAGLMDGSVSTLAPIFAAAFATQDTWQTFLIGLSASVGAGGFPWASPKPYMMMASCLVEAHPSNAGSPAVS
jgi:rubrerythrin